MRTVELVAELARTSVSFAHSRRGPALRSEKCLTESDLQSELMFLATNTIG